MLVYFVAIWHILQPFGMLPMWSFGNLSPALVCCTEKNMATLKEIKIKKDVSV
jgi:hypothetical protein